MTKESWMSVDSSLPWELQTKSDRELALDEFEWWRDRRRKAKADPAPPIPYLFFWRPPYDGLTCVMAGTPLAAEYLAYDEYWLWRWANPNEYTLYEILDIEPEMWPCLCCHEAPCICDEVM
jgi:hypothetical protein